MKFSLFILPVVIMIIAFFSGCEKKEDKSPVFSFTRPVENQQVSVYDTLRITGTITDDDIITSVEIRLLNDKNTPVWTLGTIACNETTVTLDVYYIISNKLLASGSCSLEIKATDEFGGNNYFIKLQLNSLPQKRTGLMVFSGSADQCSAYCYNESGVMQLFCSFGDRFQDAAVNSYTQQVHILGKNYGEMKTYDAGTKEILWQVSGINSLNPYNGRIKIINNYVFAGFANGNIKGYDESGTYRRNAACSNASFQPEKFILFNDYIAVEEDAIDNQINRLELIYYSSGYAATYYTIDFDVVELFPFNNEKIILWGNKNEIAKVCTLSVAASVMYEVSGFPHEKLLSVIQPEADVYLAAFGNSIYKFVPAYKSFALFSGNIHASIMKYDTLNKEVFIADGANLKVISYPSGSVLNNFVHCDSIEGIEFIYNK